MKRKNRSDPSGFGTMLRLAIFLSQCDIVRAKHPEQAFYLP